MSGGSWDYVYCKFDEVADSLINSNDVRRKSLGLLIRKIAKAMKEIEWVDSCDSSSGDEYVAIEKCFENLSMDSGIKLQIDVIEKELQQIKDLLKESIK